jgi:hypothetical protein
MPLVLTAGLRCVKWPTHRAAIPPSPHLCALASAGWPHVAAETSTHTSLHEAGQVIPHCSRSGIRSPHTPEPEPPTPPPPRTAVRHRQESPVTSGTCKPARPKPPGLSACRSHPPPTPLRPVRSLFKDQIPKKRESFFPSKSTGFPSSAGLGPQTWLPRNNGRRIFPPPVDSLGRPCLPRRQSG